MIENSIYQFAVPTMDGDEVSLSAFKGKVLLIVNTASDCNFTPQLKELEMLRKKYEAEDFDILAFPSNDFGGQEPLEDKSLQQCYRIDFGANFHIFDKIRVRGAYTHPLYKFLSDKKQNKHVSALPRWNFHKYLINRKGEVTDFFYPFTKPSSSRLRKRIEKLLKQTLPI
ncbi:MAG TPA: glutathione peroxidase [Sphingobacteriaceae bacterium]|nr:glutathione peroxidase [Sphingobacteriaceae bacterium]